MPVSVVSLQGGGQAAILGECGGSSKAGGADQRRDARGLLGLAGRAKKSRALGLRDADDRCLAVMAWGAGAVIDM